MTLKWPAASLRCANRAPKQRKCTKFCTSRQPTPKFVKHCLRAAYQAHCPEIVPKWWKPAEVSITMGRAKSRFNVAAKDAIVQEAYSQSKNIKATARKYGVQPKDIRTWSKQFTRVKSAVSPASWTTKSSRRSLNCGARPKHHISDDALYLFFSNLREIHHRPVSVRLICAE